MSMMNQFSTEVRRQYYSLNQKQFKIHDAADVAVIGPNSQPGSIDSRRSNKLWQSFARGWLSRPADALSSSQIDWAVPDSQFPRGNFACIHQNSSLPDCSSV